MLIPVTAPPKFPDFSANYQAMVAKEQARLEALEAARVAAEALASPQASQTVQAVQAAPVRPTVAVGGSLAQWLYKLRMCESGGNYATNTGNGFFGAYQFTIPTWNHWNTGYARADLAPPAVQDQTIIINTKASSGGLATQNPGCYRSQGLSAFPPE